MAKKFENGRGTRGLEKSKAKPDFRTGRLLSVLRQASCATEGGNWLTATHHDRWADGIAAKPKSVFVLWAEPEVFFRKEVNIISESNQATKASVNLGRALAFPGFLPG
jgi:hypothetical protein